jgi:hypothetical protein
MKFVGADLHKKSITFCVVELDGRASKVVERKRILCNQVTGVAHSATAEERPARKT